MFDANMRHLKKGTKFFADVWNVSKRMQDKGIKNKDVIFCTMLDDCDEKPTVSVMLDQKSFIVTYEEDFYDKWLVYAGYIDDEGELHDFINKESKNKARKMLNKEKQDVSK